MRGIVIHGLFQSATCSSQPDSDEHHRKSELADKMNHKEPDMFEGLLAYYK